MYPAGYGENPKVPLPLITLASQKSGMVLHFLCFYGHPTLRDWFISEWSAWERATSTEKPRGGGERVGRRANQYQKSGKKLDMGKGCVRFKKLDDLALEVVAETIARVPVDEHVAHYKAARAKPGKRKGDAKKPAKSQRR